MLSPPTFTLVLVFWVLTTPGGYVLQAQELRFKEDFEQIHWPDTSRWMGDLDHYRIDTLEEGGRVLRLNAPEAGYSTLYTYQEGIHGTWSLRIAHEFIPTTVNRSWFFLMADHPPDHETISGYALRFGESGVEKSIRLLRYDQGKEVPVSSLPWPVPEGTVQVQVTRDEIGNWEIRSRAAPDQEWLRSERVQDSVHQKSLYSGLISVYSNTRRDRIWIDDLSFATRPGVFELLDAEVEHQNRVVLRFSQRVSSIRVDSIPIRATDGTAYLSKALAYRERIHLTVDVGLPDGEYTIPLDSIRNGVEASPSEAEAWISVRNPFGIASYGFKDDATLELAFTLPPSERARFGDRVSLSGQPPMSVDWLDSTRISLSFSNSFDYGEHSLHLEDVRSRDGWSLPHSRSTVIRHHDPVAGNIAISELLFDPSHLGDPFIELSNVTDKFLSLENWMLIRKGRGMDRDRFLTEEPFTMYPGQRIVLARDLSILKPTFPEAEWIQMRDFPGLNRAAEDVLLLLTPDGEVSDSITYHPSRWQADGRSLERRSLQRPGWIPENWGLSSAAASATPGAAALVEPDTIPPTLVRAEFVSADSIQVSFSEYLEAALPEALRLAGNPTADGSVPIKALWANGRDLHVVLSRQMHPDSVLSLRVKGVRDIFGNVSEVIDLRIRYHDPADTVRPGDVVINEFQRVASDEVGEFIELHNTREQAVRLDGWRLSVQSQAHVIGVGTFIRPMDFLVIPVRDWTPTMLDPEQWTRIPSFTSIPNTRGTLVLSTPDAIPSDSLAYGPEWGIRFDSLSLQRLDPSAPSSDPTRWSEGIATPGRVNHDVLPDNAPPRIWMAHVSGALDSNSGNSDSLILLFDEFPILLPDAVLHLDEQPVNVPLQGALTARNHLHIPLPEAWSGDRAERVSVTGIADVKDNRAEPIRSPIVRPPRHGDLIISEVMFHPLQDPEDGRADQTQFIELYNRSHSWLLLDAMQFHLGWDETGKARLYQPLCTFCPAHLPHPLVPPGAFVLIHPHNQETSYAESPIASAFPASATHEWKGPLEHPWLLNLPSGSQNGSASYWAAGGLDPPFTPLRIPGKTLSLHSASNRIHLLYGEHVIDSAWVDASHHHWHVELTQGRSLERIHLDADGFDAANWGTSADPSGATPGAVNTLRMDAPPSIDAPLVLHPNPFSPDEDALEDILEIHYRLPSVDFQLRARIFDRWGRLIRRVAEGQSAGSEGTLLWNGRDESGHRIPVGLYVILFEAFNSRDHPPVRHKMPVIVAGR